MKTYGDACGTARALDIVGERWAIPVVRELIFGPRRYTDLADALPGVSTNILGARLKDLAHSGVIHKRKLPPPAASTVYELTVWGAELEPVLIALGQWAAHTPIDLERQALSATSFALSLKSTFDPIEASETQLDVRLFMGEDIFDLGISGTRFTISRARAAQPDDFHLCLHATPKALATLVYQRVHPSQSTARIDGPHDLVEAFASCFTVPQRAHSSSPVEMDHL